MKINYLRLSTWIGILLGSIGIWYIIVKGIMLVIR